MIPLFLLLLVVGLQAGHVNFDMNWHCDIRKDFTVNARICDDDDWSPNDCMAQVNFQCHEKDCYQDLHFYNDSDPGKHFELYIDVDHDCNDSKQLVWYRYPRINDDFIYVKWDRNSRLPVNITLTNKVFQAD